jgi:hypothetical protein
MFMLNCWKMKTQQKRASREPQRCDLLLLLHISQVGASTDELRYAWLATTLHGIWMCLQLQ